MDRYEFIWKAIQKHGYKYGYRKVEYVKCSKKVKILCPIHGEFEQRPDLHIQGCGCQKCTGKLITSDEEFKYNLFKIYGDKYDFSKTEYINARTKVTLICPIHGEFKTIPSYLLKKHGCPNCNKTYTKDFIEKAILVHGEKYDYSKVNYKNCRTKIVIICPEHGEFYQTPNGHLNGYGCSKCAIKKNKSELKLLNTLNYHFNNVIYQYKNKELFGSFMSLDFYLPKYNIGIEYQGRQHFLNIDCFGGEKGYEDIQERDKIKYDKCINNDIKLLYFTYDKRNVPSNYLSEIFTDENELLNKIKEYKYELDTNNS